MGVPVPLCAFKHAFSCDCESHVWMMCDLHSPHHTPSHILQLRYCAVAVLRPASWCEATLICFSPWSQSTVTGFWSFLFFSEHLTLQLWAAKTVAFHLLWDLTELLKRMNNHHQNTRMFIRDWTGSSTNQLRERDKREWLEREWNKGEKVRERVYGQSMANNILA